MKETRTRENETGVARKYHKDTFDKIPDKKRERIMKIATAEFADKGFNGANINVIAKKANISIGSMYNYFSTKEHLLLACVEDAYSLLEGALSSVNLEEGTVFDKLEKVMRLAIHFSKSHPTLIQLYQDITTEGLAHLSRKLSQKMENISAVFYRSQIEEAKAQGLVDADLDIRVATLCIDNIVVLLQFSYTSEYYKERLKVFVGDDAFGDDERVIAGIMKFIRNALSARAPR
ncbi:MAG: TetR/AcrR family transcriptional regulator [Spirochaetes bacterium]|nr:MAG: TetR/AcrR family transcriptional regulator [Spirochaetota bacterium]